MPDRCAVDLRVSTMPSAHGERVVLRILDRQNLTFNLEELGVPTDLLANMTLPSNFIVSRLFKWTKSAPGYRVFGLAARFILKDRRATFRAMLADIEAHPPTIMVPAHGAIVSRESCASETTAMVQAAV